MPERVPMQMTGHKTRSVGERYNIISPNDLGEAALKRYPDDDHWVMLEKNTQVAQDIRRFVDDKDLPKESAYRAVK